MQCQASCVATHTGHLATQPAMAPICAQLQQHPGLHSGVLLGANGNGYVGVRAWLILEPSSSITAC